MWNMLNNYLDSIGMSTISIIPVVINIQIIKIITTVPPGPHIGNIQIIPNSLGPCNNWNTLNKFCILEDLEWWSMWNISNTFNNLNIWIQLRWP